MSAYKLTDFWKPTQVLLVAAKANLLDYAIIQDGPSGRPLVMALGDEHDLRTPGPRETRVALRAIEGLFPKDPPAGPALVYNPLEPA